MSASIQTSEPPLIRIVDDDEALRDALVYMLANEGWKSAAYPDAKAFLRDESPSRPGVLILDIQMPGMSGLELHKELRKQNYELPIIFLTAHGSVNAAVDTLRHGAFHFLQKPVDSGELLEAVNEAVAEDRRRRSGLPDADEIRTRISLLTKREYEIMRFLTQGLLNADIAVRLQLSVRTVEAHRASAYVKLKVKSVAEASQLFALAAKNK